MYSLQHLNISQKESCEWGSIMTPKDLFTYLYKFFMKKKNKKKLLFGSVQMYSGHDSNF